jgi:hypothetical protein
MIMLWRLLLSVGFVLVLAPAVTAEPPTRVVTEDASVAQCRSGICTTLQVTRTTMSNGEVETLLFFSHTDADGNPIPVVGFPSGFTLIPSGDFFMNRRGTAARLKHLSTEVIWEDTDDFRGDSFSLEIEREKATDGSGQFTVSRVSERRQQISANAAGTVGDLKEVVIDTTAPPTSIGDFASAFLIELKTVSRTRVK